MKGWKKRTVGTEITLKRGHDLPSHKRKPGVIPIFSSSGISGYHSEAKCIAPGVITGRYGTVGQVFYAPNDYWPLNTTLYVEDFKGNFPKFVYYFLQILDWEQFNDKSAVPGINRNDVHTEEVYLPGDIKEQKAIADVLSSLDDKIDLLHRQNTTLEAMAEALFRQRFVVEAKDEWEEKSLLHHIQLVGGGTPKTSIPEYWNGLIFWLSGGDIANSHKTFTLSSQKSVTEEGIACSSAKILPQYTTVLTARGTVGKFCLLGQPMAYSQTNYGILPKHSKAFFFVFLLIDHIVKELQTAAYGSVFDTITTQTFEETSIALPEVDVIKNFELQVRTYFGKMLANQAQIRTLERLRDTILPKLMSGEVKVEYEAETQ